MAIWRRLESWLSWFPWYRRRAREAELERELRDHLELEAEEQRAAGLSPKEAAQAAHRALGNSLKVEEDVRAAWGFQWFETLAQDVLYAFRMLRKSPGFTAVAVLTLALGIGANTAIFSAAYSILLRPLPYQDSSRLVTIGALAPGDFIGGSDLSMPAIEKIKSRTHAFDQVISVEFEVTRLSGPDAPEILMTGYVSGNYFPALGVKPLLGRLILPPDAQTGSPHVVVLSYAFWRKHFNGDPRIVGKQIDLAGGYYMDTPSAPYTVVGIAPASFASPGYYGWDYDVWIPRLPRGEDYPYLGGDNFTVARLLPGVTVEQANEQLRSLSLALGEQYPQEDKGQNLHAQLLQEMIVQKSRLALLVLLGAVGFLLLIACVNVSNLSLARGWARLREIAIRETLGATRLRVVSQLLTETILLALLGCALGLLLGYFGVGVLRANAPAGTPRVGEIGLYAAVFWYALGISVAAGIAFGLGPALQVSGRNLPVILKSSRTTPLLAEGKRRPGRYRNILIISEVALSVALFIGSVLMIRSFDKLISVPLGLRTDHILTMEADLDPAVYKKGQQASEALDQMLDRIRSLPGVQLAAIADYPPLEGGGIRTVVTVEGQPATPPGQPGPSTKVVEVDASYFSVLGIRLLQGRNFTLADSPNSQAVGIVNQAFAKKFLGGDAIGKRLQNGVDKKKKPLWRNIVGVVSDARDENPAQAPAPELYQPFFGTDSPSGGVFLVRTSMDPDTLAPAIRDEIWAVSKSTVIDETKTMDQIAAKTVAEPKFQTFLLASFAVLGLLLAVVGIYGVISYSVSQRTHEIGVRLALGAGPHDILRFVVGNTMLLALAGIGIGLAVSFALTRYLRSLLFEVKPTDPLTFACVALLFLLVALAACYLPAHRATRVDPMVALRYE